MVRLTISRYSRPMVETRDTALARAIGEEIAHWRRRRSLTQAQLAKKVDLSKNTIGRYERGETMPDVTESWRIAKALQVPLSQIIARAEAVLRSDRIEISDEGDDVNL